MKVSPTFSPRCALRPAREALRAPRGTRWSRRNLKSLEEPHTEPKRFSPRDALRPARDALEPAESGEICIRNRQSQNISLLGLGALEPAVGGKSVAGGICRAEIVLPVAERGMQMWTIHQDADAM